MKRTAQLRALGFLLAGAALTVTLGGQQPVDLAGTWQSNIGQTYTITQSGTHCTWQSQGATGTITFTPAGLATSWTDAGGTHSAVGTVSERDATGRPVRITWNNGVVFQRSPTPAVPAGVSSAPVVPASPDLAGTWSSSIGLSYVMTRVGQDFQWQDSAGGRGTVRLTPAGVTASWSDATGPHTAAGVIVERDSAGRPTRITWSNGVVFMRPPTAPGAAPAAGPMAPAGQPVPASPPAAAADLEGRWTSNIGEQYGIRQTTNGFLWRARSGTEGTITVGPNGLLTTWSDATGPHSATGTVAARDASGRPTRIVWSHGVVFERQSSGAAPGTPAVVLAPSAVAQPPVPAAPPQTGVSPGQPTMTTMTEMIQATLPTYPSVMGIEVAVNRPGGDISNFELDEPRPELCRDACAKHGSCRAFTYVRPGAMGPKARCWLKASVPAGVVDNCCFSGVMPPLPMIAAPGAGAPPLTATAGTPNAEKGPRRPPLDPAAQQTLPRVQHHMQNWKAQVPAAYRAANRELSLLQRARFDAQVSGLAKLAAEPGAVEKLLGDPGALALKITTPTLAAAPVQMAAAQLLVSPAMSAGQLGLQPVVERILSAGSNAPAGTVDEGRVFYVAGRGLGTAPGIVRLQFTRRESESGPPTSYTLDLLPGSDTWERSWSESAVAVKLPYLPTPIPVRGTVDVYIPGASKMPLQYPVAIEGHQFVISGIATAPIWADLEHPHVLVPGGELVIVGRDLGASGSVKLQFTEPITPYGRDPLVEVDLTPLTKWQDTRIVASIPGDLQGSYPFQGARLRLRNSLGHEVMQGIRFGPRMEFRVLSGFEFMEFAQADAKDTAEAEVGILTVTHDPGCGLKGNEGDDWFFSAKPLPPNTRVARYTFSWVDPNEPDLAEQLFDEALDWLKKGIYWKIAEGFGRLFLSIFDSKMGSYKVNATNLPQPGLPDRLRVHWENSCWGPYDGIPNIYHISFVVWAPEGTFPPT